MRCLIVDDSPTDAFFVSKILTDLGHAVFTIYDPLKLEQVCQEFGPDVIFMDIVMPGKNGFESLRDFKTSSARKETPVVMLSSKDDTSDRVWAERQGAAGHIGKPAKRAEIASVLAGLFPS